MLRDFFKSQCDIFAEVHNTNKTHLIQHRIEIGQAHLIRQCPRRLPLAKQQEAEELVTKILKQGVILLFWS